MGVVYRAYDPTLDREARAAAKLLHLNIVMEFVRGSMLDAMSLSGGLKNKVGIVKVLTQCASVLDAAHALALVHRDIKPGNILIDENGSIKITDFGIARIISAGATKTMSTGMGLSVGTPGYMALPGSPSLTRLFTTIHLKLLAKIAL